MSGDWFWLRRRDMRNLLYADPNANELAIVKKVRKIWLHDVSIWRMLLKPDRELSKDTDKFCDNDLKIWGVIQTENWHLPRIWTRFLSSLPGRSPATFSSYYSRFNPRCAIARAHATQLNQINIQTLKLEKFSNGSLSSRFRERVGVTRLLVVFWYTIISTVSSLNSGNF